VSLPAAYEYSHHPNIDLVFLGDRISKNSQIAVGGSVISRLNGIKADLCFLGTNAIDVKKGITDNDWEVAEVKKAMIEASSHVVSLSITEKLNTVQRIKVCDLSGINTLITELNPGDPALKPYRQTGIRIL